MKQLRTAANVDARKDDQASVERDTRVAGRPGRLRAFTLLEIILVLALIGIAAAILVPSVTNAFTLYHLERAGEDFETRLARVRLQAIESGVPYALTFRPNSDQFVTWACEPLSANTGMLGAGSLPTTSAVGDAYDRHVYELNDNPDNREFRFLPSTLDEALATMGLTHEGRSVMDPGASGTSVAGSIVLSRRKLGLVSPSLRSTAALQIPGLQLGDVAEPIVFEPDGTADRDAIIRIADQSNRYIEITVHSLTGTVSASEVLSVQDMSATADSVSTRRTGFVTPSRSRELRQGIGGGE